MSQRRQAAVLWHDDVLLHDSGKGLFEAAASELLDVQEPHPEGPARIRNIRAVLERGPLRERLRWESGRHASQEELATIHDPAYVESIRRLSAAGGGRPTPTTVASAETFRAACAAAGTAIAATEAVLRGRAPVAYALVRPPGHHAQPAQVDGYCFFNNVALAAQAAIEREGLSRVAIIDWDVHHGNGTQECFYERADVLTISLHMSHGAWGPTHPQTGGPEEVGAGPGRGLNLNLELPLGTGDEGYVSAMERAVVPAVDRFAPQLLLVAAGQDASQFDPNGRQALSMAGFRQLGAIARTLADRHCDGRLVLVQEGGYAPTYAAFCAHATLEGVLDTGVLLPEPLAYLPDQPGRADAAIDAALAAHTQLAAG
ncbi:MAG TPA: histone deacetylase [Solirubrobacteraceae bacterium]|nr:histone deacetylase [Solirubrobacteraceae bacterium]